LLRYFDLEIFDSNPADHNRLQRRLLHDHGYDLSNSHEADVENDDISDQQHDSDKSKSSSGNTPNSQPTSQSQSPEPFYSSPNIREVPPPAPTVRSSIVGEDDVLESQKKEQKSEVTSRKAKIMTFLHQKFPRRILHRMIKASLAYLTTIILCYIQPIQDAIGPSMYLAVTGCLFTHPGRTMGAQIDATITSVIGVVLAVCWAMAGMAASVSYNRQYIDDLANHQVGVAINATFLVIGVMFAQILRMRFPKFQFFSLQFMIVQIFCNTKFINLTEMDYKGILQFGIPLILGAGVSLFWNLILWRETAVDGLGKSEFKKSLVRNRAWCSNSLVQGEP
jgi:hypothetical protein